MIGTEEDRRACAPGARRAPSRQDVLVVDPDERASALLRRYLEARGWSVDVRAARAAVRQWGTTLVATNLLLTLEDDDPDAFELLASVAARAVEARVIVCASASLGVALPASSARALGVERVLCPHPSFSELARILDESARRVSATVLSPVQLAASGAEGA
jgi:DNA-binding response OmpR family regulator